MKQPKRRSPSPTRPKRGPRVPVAMSCPIVREDLPWPIVYYPGGTFFAFGKSESAPLALCSCAEPAVVNYFRLHGDYFRPETAQLLKESETAPTEPRQIWAEARPDLAEVYLNGELENLFPGYGRVAYAPTFAMGAGAFPFWIVRGFLSNLEDPFQTLRFEPRLCHRCNQATPTLRWAIAAYAGRFKQYHGWYISQHAYRLGVVPSLAPVWNGNPTNVYLEDVCPSGIADLIKRYVAAYAPAIARKNALLAWDSSERNRLLTVANLEDEPDEVMVEKFRLGQSEADKLSRKITNYFEDITRKEFGFRKIGEGWISESLLYSLIAKIFLGEEILRHHRPPWLQGLELDIYIPNHRLAFEYQGQQHFYAIPAWGGESALSTLRARDAQKAQLCMEQNIRLITVDYTEALTIGHIRSVIEPNG